MTGRGIPRDFTHRPKHFQDLEVLEQHEKQLKQHMRIMEHLYPDSTITRELFVCNKVDIFDQDLMRRIFGMEGRKR